MYYLRLTYQNTISKNQLTVQFWMFNFLLIAFSWWHSYWTMAVASHFGNVHSKIWPIYTKCLSRILLHLFRHIWTSKDRVFFFVDGILKMWIISSINKFMFFLNAEILKQTTNHFIFNGKCEKRLNISVREKKYAFCSESLRFKLMTEWKKNMQKQKKQTNKNWRKEYIEYHHIECWQIGWMVTIFGSVHVAVHMGQIY